MNFQGTLPSGERTLGVDKEMAIKMEMAHQLHEGLGQHLLGTLLAAQALADALNADASPRSRQASLVVNLLKGADTQLRSLILEMDGKLPR